MEEKKYKVCKGKKITGRKKVFKEGVIFSLIDFIGDIDVAIDRGLCEEIKKPKKESKASNKKQEAGI